MEKADWYFIGLNVIVHDGIVHLSGVILEEEARQAAVVTAENVEGVRKVRDHLCWFNTITGAYLNSLRGRRAGKGRLQSTMTWIIRMLFAIAASIAALFVARDALDFGARSASAGPH